MYAPIFTINNSDYDSSTHFDLVINSQIDQAIDNKAPHIWTINFIKTANINSRTNNTPLQIKVPILPEYPGYTQDEAVQAIRAYINSQIKTKFEAIKQKSNMAQANKDYEVLDFFRDLDICKDLDLDNLRKENSDMYFKNNAELIADTRFFVGVQKNKRQPVPNGDIKLENGTVVHLEPFVINNTEIDQSVNFSAMIASKIQEATQAGRPTMLSIDFIKNDALKSNATNTPLQIIVPIKPINPKLNEKETKMVRWLQLNAIMTHIYSQIEQKYQSIKADNNPNAKKDNEQFIKMLRRLDISKGLDIYDSEKMIADANKIYATYIEQINGNQPQ